MPGERPAGEPGDREGAGDDPDLEVAAVERPGDVPGQDRQRRADREQAEAGDDEDPGERGLGGGEALGEERHPAIDSVPAVAAAEAIRDRRSDEP